MSGVSSDPLDQVMEQAQIHTDPLALVMEQAQINTAWWCWNNLTPFRREGGEDYSPAQRRQLLMGSIRDEFWKQVQKEGVNLCVMDQQRAKCVFDAIWANTETAEAQLWPYVRKMCKKWNTELGLLGHCPRVF